MVSRARSSEVRPLSCWDRCSSERDPVDAGMDSYSDFENLPLLRSSPNASLALRGNNSRAQFVRGIAGRKTS